MSQGLQLSGSRKIRVSHSTPVIAGLFCIWFILSVAIGESPSLSISVGLVALLAAKLLWRPGEPPTLLLLIAVHLVQVSTTLIHANVLGVNVNTMSPWGIDLEYATWVAVGAVLCLALGMTLGQAGPAIWTPSLARAEANAWSPKGAFGFFIITLAIDLLFTRLSYLAQTLSQLFLAGAGIQWIGVFVLTYVCFVQKRGFGYFFVAMGVEVISGFLGFFGEFRNVFFVLFVAIATAGPRLKIRTIVSIIAGAAIALVLSAFWSAIKTDYRSFLNQHTGAQMAVVPVEARLSYLATQVENANMDTLRKGFDALWTRMAYVEFFGAALQNVPANRPHEDGALTAKAILHIIAPRLFFPDKDVLESDTEVTKRYTGLPIMIRSDTSISLGYAGEFYVDFGVIGLFVCMGILGFCYGKMTRIVQLSFKSPLVAYGATLPLLIPGFMFETSLPKVLGGVTVSFVILVLMGRTLVPILEKKFLRNLTVRSKIPG